jgi:hypothetical protein
MHSCCTGYKNSRPHFKILIKKVLILNMETFLSCTDSSHFGGNLIKLMHFGEKKEIFCFIKPANLARISPQWKRSIIVYARFKLFRETCELNNHATSTQKLHYFKKEKLKYRNYTLIENIIVFHFYCSLGVSFAGIFLGGSFI